MQSVSPVLIWIQLINYIPLPGVSWLSWPGCGYIAWRISDSVHTHISRHSPQFCLNFNTSNWMHYVYSSDHPNRNPRKRNRRPLPFADQLRHRTDSVFCGGVLLPSSPVRPSSSKDVIEGIIEDPARDTRQSLLDSFSYTNCRQLSPTVLIVPNFYTLCWRETVDIDVIPWPTDLTSYW